MSEGALDPGEIRFDLQRVQLTGSRAAVAQIHESLESATVGGLGQVWTLSTLTEPDSQVGEGIELASGCHPHEVARKHSGAQRLAEGPEPGRTPRGQHSAGNITAAQSEREGIRQALLAQQVAALGHDQQQFQKTRVAVVT